MTTRKRRFAERRQVKTANEAVPMFRLSGKCDLCSSFHPLPDGREVCAICGQESCWIGCVCQRVSGGMVDEPK